MSDTDVNPYQSPEARIEDRQHWRQRDKRPLASLGARLGGWIVDGVSGLLVSIPFVVALVSFVISGASTSEAPTDDEFFAVLFEQYPGYMAAWVGLLLLLALVNLVFFIQSSQSIGKRIVGTQIATLDGKPAGAGRIVGLRVILSQIIYGLPIVGVLIYLVGNLMIFGKNRRCLHDHVAGTIVVQYRARSSDS